MIKKTVQYTDFNGDAQTEDLYFNITKAELTEMALSVEGGLDVKIKKITEAKNSKELIEIFKDILTRSVGRRSEDGKRFVKNSVITEEFTSSEAFSTLFMELAFDEGAAAEFIKGIMPKDLVADESKLTIPANA